MRVKLLIALTLASVFLIAGMLPAGAVCPVQPTGISVSVPTALTAGIANIATVVPCFSQTAPSAPTTGSLGALGTVPFEAPGIAATIDVGSPCVPGFVSPSFVAPTLFAPTFNTLSFTAPVLFDP